jgi:hypothetical protein
MDLRFEDLYTICTSCRGGGTLTETTGSGGMYGMGPTITSGPCHACNGKGGKMTESGAAIVKFLQLLRSKSAL